MTSFRRNTTNPDCLDLSFVMRPKRKELGFSLTHGSLPSPSPSPSSSFHERECNVDFKRRPSLQAQQHSWGSFGKLTQQGRSDSKRKLVNSYHNTDASSDGERFTNVDGTTIASSNSGFFDEQSSPSRRSSIDQYQEYQYYPKNRRNSMVQEKETVKLDHVDVDLFDEAALRISVESTLCDHDEHHPHHTDKVDHEHRYESGLVGPAAPFSPSSTSSKNNQQPEQQQHQHQIHQEYAEDYQEHRSKYNTRLKHKMKKTKRKLGKVLSRMKPGKKKEPF